MGICTSDLNKVGAVYDDVATIPVVPKEIVDKTAPVPPPEVKKEEKVEPAITDSQKLLETQKKDKHQIPLRKRQVYIGILIDISML